MEDILARYLDGEIEEEEAGLLLRMAAEDPRLERELRAYEALLAAAERLPERKPPDGFADSVMRSIENRVAAPPDIHPQPAIRRWYAAAAALILGIFLGYVGSSGIEPDRGGGEAGAAAYPALVPVHVALSYPGAQRLRAVRLSYAGSRSDLKSVAVAGSFNGWDPQDAQMVREDGAWTILLLLPPGDHEYMFVEDGESWVTDPHAPGKRQDGFGGENGLLAVRS